MNRFLIGVLLMYMMLLSYPSVLVAQEVTTHTTEAEVQLAGGTHQVSERILATDSLLQALSPEALRIIGRPFNPLTEQYHRGEDLFSSFLFAPLVLDLQNTPSLDFAKNVSIPYRESLLKMSVTPLVEQCLEMERKRMSQSRVAQVIRQKHLADKIREGILLEQPHLVQVTSAHFPEKLEVRQVDAQYQGELKQIDGVTIPIEAKKSKSLQELVDRKYWVQKFESNLHFAQSAVSENWHKGGHNSLNLNGRIYYGVTYKRDRVNWSNELEYKIGLFANDVLRRDHKTDLDLKLSEDIFRLNSNFGVEAYKRWYYTIDLQLRSQLMKNSKADGQLTTRAFAPLQLDAGFGMKYELVKKKIGGNPYKNFKLVTNMAPLAASFVYTYADDIDKGRIGLQVDERHRLRIGSSVRLALDWDFSDMVSWRSRAYYTTSYKHVEAELENALTLSFNRFISARLSVDFRYDDSVIIDKPKTFKNLLQYNQLVSLGFELKL